MTVMTDKQDLAKKLNREARFLHISIPYDKDDECGLISFDDGVMTELECEDGFVPPMLNADSLRLEVTVDLRDRKVLDWGNNKNYIRMWAKVCDSGTYTLLDAEWNPLWQIDGYVPNKLIPPYEKGWGDYVELAIESDGSLPQWKEELDFSEFVEEGTAPKTIATNRWHKAESAYYDVMQHHLDKEEMIWLLQRLLAKYSLSIKQVVEKIIQ